MLPMQQILILKKDEKISIMISEGSIKDIYAMLYAAISHVSQNTNQSVETTLDILLDLHEYLKSTNQNLNSQ